MLNLAVPCVSHKPQRHRAESTTATADREEFKNEAVRLVTTGTRSVPDVARSLGISENLLYRWKGYSKQSGRQNEITQQDYDQLREQLRRTEQDRTAEAARYLKKSPPGGPVEHFQSDDLTLSYGLTPS